MTETVLPQRTARISDETQAEIVRLAIRQVPQGEIARRTDVHRHTVTRVLKRTRGALQINEDTGANRAEAIAVYREIQRTAWDTIEQGRSPAMLLAEVRMAQQRIDALLGLAPIPDDPYLRFQELRAAILGVVVTEAPEVAQRIAQRLMAGIGGTDEHPIIQP